MLFDKPALRAAILYAVFGVAWIVLSDKVMLVFAPDMLIFSQIETWKGLAFVLASAFAFYLGLRGRFHERVALAGNFVPQGARPSVLSFALLASAIVIAGLGGAYYIVSKQKAAEVGRLQVIGALKAGQIEAWLEERLGDAQALHSDDSLVELYQRWRQRGDEASRKTILKRLDAYRHSFHYTRVLLLDQSGEAVLTVGATELPASPRLRDTVLLAIKEGRVLSTDLYRLTDPGSDEVHLEFVAPLPAVTGQPRLAVVLDTDPSRFLFPFIQPWPVPSASAETLLFRRDGDHVLFLNELRHRTGTALRLRLPFSQSRMLGVQVLEGKMAAGNPVEGVDYRGVPVLGVVEPVKETSWYLVAKLDKDELYAQARRDIGWIIFVSSLALILLAVTSVLLRQRRELYFSLFQRQQQAEKLQALQLLDGIANASTDAIFVKDVAGRYLLVNPAAVSIVGKAKEEILGKDDTAIFPPEEAERISAVDRDVLQGAEAIAYENELHTADGVRTLLETKGPLRNEHGQVIGLFGIARDITEYKRAERTIRKSELHYRSLFENMLEGLAQCRMIYQNGLPVDFVYLDVNPAFEQLTGLRNVIGRKVSELIPGVRTATPELFEIYGRVADGGQPERFEIYVAGLDIWFSISAYSSEQDCFVAVFGNITERKRSEEKMRQAAMVFDSTRDGIAIADLGGQIIAVNRSFTEVTGYSEAEMLNQNPRILKSDRHDPDFYRDLWAMLLETGSWQGEIWNRRKGGEIYPELLTISTVRDSLGQPTHYVGVFTDTSQIWHSKEDLVHLAHYDTLTDLPNRLLAQSSLEHALARVQRHGHRVGVLYLDLDQFKTINDSLGHHFGDELLVAVAQRLKSRVRGEDILARLGGDEFLIVLEPIEVPQEAADVARGLLEALVEPFRLSCDQEVYISASIGISVFPEDGVTQADLLRDADAAMYQAKESGGNQFCFYTGDMNVDALARLELEAALRRALERGELLLHYQPKVNLKTGRMSGAEALIRWQREGIGLVPPAQFIPLAEKSDLIVSIGNWVIDSACRQIRAWIDAGWPDVHVAVNISARQFRIGKLDEVVAVALEKHAITADHLELEVTESMLMERPDEAVTMLNQLKAIGVKLSLDDFGTGYSSLTYLMRFPIDNLKIDQSFVRDIVSDPDAAAIAISIIGLAHRMRLRVVAEGVETESQLGYLRMRGCDEMQGYYFSRPVSAEAFLDLMQTGKVLPAAEESAPETRTLLIVDDEPHILTALRRLLRNDGYHILTAASAREGLEILAQHSVQVILSDQRMPEMSGTEFLHRVKDLHPNTVRIVLSGYTDLESITRAVNEGALYKFVTKPWDDDLLREHVHDAFCYYEAIILPRDAQ